MEKKLSHFWQRVNDYGNDELRDSFSHSGAYHRHFQGYAEQRVARKRGTGTRIKRIYAADYYRYMETDSSWQLKKLVYVLMFAMAAAAAVTADSLPLAINRIPAVEIAQILSFLPLIYLLYKLILQVSAPRRMTIGERNSTVTEFQRAALICGAYLLAIALAMPIEKWIVFQTIEPSDWIVIGLNLLSGILALALYFLEKERRLEIVPNQVQIPTGANEIW